MAYSEYIKFSISSMQHDAGVGLGSHAVGVELAWLLKEFARFPALWIRFNPAF